MAIDKKRLHKSIKQLQHIKTWQLIVILLLVSLVSVMFLRMNNLNMLERRDAVVAADKKGDRKAIKASLIDLRNYVSHHMNTSLDRGVDLRYSFDRDVKAAIAKAQKAGDTSGSAYRQADAACKKRFTGGVSSFRNDYVQCVVNKTDNLKTGQPELKLPNKELYHYNFASLIWSPDLAGLFVVLSGVIVVMIIIRSLSLLVLNILLKWRFQSI